MKKFKTALTFSVFFALGMIFFSSTANAYIDPSAMTYIVQVVAGIVIAGGAAFAFYFKKIKRKIRKSVNSAKEEDYDTREDVTYDDDDEFDDSDLAEDDFDESDSDK